MWYMIYGMAYDSMIHDTVYDIWYDIVNLGREHMELVFVLNAYGKWVVVEFILTQECEVWFEQGKSLVLGHLLNCVTDPLKHSAKKTHPTMYYKQLIMELPITLWWTNIAMENHHFWWGNPLFLWPFSIAMLVHQRVENDKQRIVNSLWKYFHSWSPLHT